jgi:hypothetical protein
MAYYRYDIFLSYSHRDKKKAMRIAQVLREAGYKIFFDEDVIRPGESIRVAIERGIYASRALVVLIGEKPETRQNTFFELGLFLGLSRDSHIVLPIIIDKTPRARLPYDISQFKALHWDFDDPEHSLDQIWNLLGSPAVPDEASFTESEVSAQKKTIELTFDIDNLSIEEQEQLLRTIETLLGIHNIKVESRRKGSEIYRISLDPEKAAKLFYEALSGKFDDFANSNLKCNKC